VKIFRALSAIYSGIGIKASIVVLIDLFQSFCIPVLLYGTDTVLMARRLVNALQPALGMALFEVFKVDGRRQ
jgi:hypothetical protein